MDVNADSTAEEVEAWLFQIGRKHLAVESKMTVSEWADAYRVLSAKSSGEPGPWRTDRTPYLREIMDSLSSDSPYELIVLEKGAQVGGTECLLNWLAYIVDRAPRPTMIVWPTEKDIKDNVRVRLEPMFQTTPRVGEKIGDPKGPKDSANNQFLKEFPGGFLAFAASNSTANLRSKPVCNVAADEVDEFPGNANQQGDPITLAEARTKTFGIRRKMFMLSTPTVEGDSRIDLAFSQTDQRHYYVPCPHCGAYQVLVWEQMRHDKAHPDEAYYECIKCALRIENHHKTQMLANGEWRPHAVSTSPKRVGFHISALYSPVGMYSWADAASDYWAAVGNANKFRAWTNTVLGLPYQEKGERPEWEQLYYRREEYATGTLAPGVLLLTAGADVQKDRIEVEVVGWGRDKESWSIDYHVFHGDTSDIQSEAWNLLRDLMSRTYLHPTGVQLQIQSTALDSGYNTQTVYNWARQYAAPKVAVVKGEDSRQELVGIAKYVDVVDRNGKRFKRAVKRFPVGVSLIKSELYGWLRLPLPDMEDRGFPPGFCHFPQYNEEFFRQLTAEQLETRNVRGSLRPVYEWKKVRERNEALDCRVYARAAASILGLDLFQAHHWDRLEMSIGSLRDEDIPRPGNAPNQPGPQARPTRSRYRNKGTRV